MYFRCTKESLENSAGLQLDQTITRNDAYNYFDINILKSEIRKTKFCLIILTCTYI